ncbi:MAG TPA: enoyl-CoA hydratase-related protein [Marmoricola sp.]|nr:enoyl-CoA hydratase-related protein [Marmoricola sp.]
MTVVHQVTADQVMTVVLDGPDSLNSLTPEAVDGLEAALDIAEADPTLRAMVITGAGDRAFCVGMDIDFLGPCFADPLGTFLPFLRRLDAALERLENLGFPVIAKVNGLARAGGLELILACDFVIAADEAKVGDIHLEFGMPPGAGGSQRAPRKLGEQRAKLLLMTPTWLDGPTMVAWGLALSSVPRTQLDDQVASLVAMLRGRSRPAMAVVKRLIGAPRSMTFEEGMRYERELFSRLHEQYDEVAEGYQAFVDKRTPSWRDVDNRAFR